MPNKNPFEQPGTWFRANLHTHTTNSDGREEPQARVNQYREAGYDILAITDHRMVTQTDTLDAGDMLLLCSMEAHPPCPGGPLYHLVCLNIPQDFDHSPDTDANTFIQQVREAGGEVICAHPYWCGRTIPQILALENLVGMEVYNSTCGRIGKASSSVIWDSLLQAGRRLPAVAVDDTHANDDLFGGWTMVRAETLDVDAVMDAIRTGSYYATSGPVIEDFRIRDGEVEAKFSPVREVNFRCQGSCGRRIQAPSGEVLTEARFKLPANPGYVRLEIEDEEGHHAWTNPLFPRKQ
ncbi:MAG: CehA/McbA family metallohydrolase [Lentisphaeria bacterium]|nr:CehA/McbA family metallohydrolase [Lentisphaeria bacterium]